ncbi:MAG TPA: hypothetical protein VJU81_06835 [Methylomirabilota bacterium]|nr:hypothetical protein [Methylomirabilota bacterium]
MAIIDSQVHAYEANTPKRPWHSVPNWPDHVTGDEMVAAMDRVGVDEAIFISAFSMYRYDAGYAVEVQRAHPDRLALVKPVVNMLCWGNVAAGAALIDRHPDTRFETDRLSASERALLMGGACAKAYGWSPRKA